MKTVIRFVSLCNGFHWLGDIAVIGLNGFVCVCVDVWVCLFLCVFAPSGGDDQMLNIITGFYEFMKLPVSISGADFDLYLTRKA